MELERGVARGQLRPQAPNAEVPLAHVGVVEDDDAAVRQGGPPRLEVVQDGLVAVHPVNVQQVH
jgi:hypothetical protein